MDCYWWTTLLRKDESGLTSSHPCYKESHRSCLQLTRLSGMKFGKRTRLKKMLGSFGPYTIKS